MRRISGALAVLLASMNNPECVNEQMNLVFNPSIMPIEFSLPKYNRSGNKRKRSRFEVRGW